MRLGTITYGNGTQDNALEVRNFTIEVPNDSYMKVDHRIVKVTDDMAKTGSATINLTHIADVSQAVDVNKALGQLACIGILKALWEADLAMRRRQFPR